MRATGRLHSMTIWPLSQGELSGVHEDLLGSLARDPAATVARHPNSATSRQEYAARICAGGFPLALARPAGQRARWFAGYLRQCLERDALELSQLQQRQALAELLGRAAGQTAQLLNLTTLAEGMAIARPTVNDYFRLLEDLFLVARLPAWGKTLRSRARARPKVHVVDSGVAAYLMGLSDQRLAGWAPAVQTEFGQLVETFVVGELRKQVSWLVEPVAVGHWRTGDGAEVDVVVEFFDGSVIAFEVKASRSAGPKDFSGLRSLRAALGRLVQGRGAAEHGRAFLHPRRQVVRDADRSPMATRCRRGDLRSDHRVARMLFVQGPGQGRFMIMHRRRRFGPVVEPTPSTPREG